jgi:uncharacterized membrane protein
MEHNSGPARPPIFSSASFSPSEKEKDDRDMDRARWIILAVALLTIVVGLYRWVSFEIGLAELQADPQMTIIAEKVVEARAMILGGLLVGVIFIGLYFWARKNPFAASLAALLIYVADTVLPVVIIGDTRQLGVVRLLFLVLLLKGTHSGYRHRKGMQGSTG